MEKVLCQHQVKNTTPMAEITPDKSASRSSGKIRAKKQSTRIDMTPMVDLAFLLLTFFILTTTFNKPHILQVDMPDKPKDTTSLPRLHIRDAFNLILAEDDKIYWWVGTDEPKLTNYSSTGIRRVLLEEARKNTRMMVLIKPNDESKFHNMVDILDEMSIVGINKFAIVDFSEEDLAMLSEAGDTRE